MPLPALRPEGTATPSLEMVPLSSLRSNPNNALRHSQANIDALARSISKYRTIIPIVINADGDIICGHARVAALRKLGMTDVPAIRAEHLSPAQQRAFALAENRLSELADWDEEALARELRFLHENDVAFDFSAIGFSAAEVEIVLGAEPTQKRRRRRPKRSNAATVFNWTPAVSEPGDVWHLDCHLLVCGPTAPDQVDAIIRRWQSDTGGQAIHGRSGRNFGIIERGRQGARKGDADE